MYLINRYTCLLASILALVLLVTATTANSYRAGIAIAILEDFADIVTQQDLGYNDFSGNMGLISDQYVTSAAHPLNCQNSDCFYRLAWDFGADTEVFTGYFFSLFGLTDTLATFDGIITETITFPHHFLNMDRIDGLLNVPARQFLEICLDFTYSEDSELQLRLELKDVDDGARFQRFSLTGMILPQTVCWDFRNDYEVPPGSAETDVTRAKLFTILIEERNVGAGVSNPTAGIIDIDRVYFTLSEPEMKPATDELLADLAARRAYQYFLDWSSRDPRSLDLPQDRSTFGDLITVGGVGFALPAHIIAAENNWISRAEAAARVHNVLTILDDEAAFGPERVGRIGHRGWFYHFLGIDGKRKLNFDFNATPVDESLNTVELSTIDTGLALMGVLAAQSYFTGADTIETEIRSMAQSIYDRVEWDFMLEPASEQFYLGWKPIEDYEGPPFEIPDGDSLGNYSGLPTDPATLDFYTDEALLLILLAAGSDAHSVDPQIYARLQFAADSDGFMRTFPGALFTYQFLPAFVDTRTWPGACPGIDWYENARQAVWRTIEYANSATAYSSYGPDAWGLSAAEGPFDKYHAYGAQPVAVANEAEEDGTVTYYGMVSAAGLGDDLYARSIQAVSAGWDRGHWHPRFGLPDAFHADVSEAPHAPPDLLRSTGPWIGRALFAIDQGPMLLHLENARSGLIWQLLAANPNIRRAIERLKTVGIQPQGLQAEDGTGDGVIMLRSRAWGLETVWLNAGETLLNSFTLDHDADEIMLFIRYSNDNIDAGPLETIEFFINGSHIGAFEAQDTGSGGLGWNIFAFSPVFFSGPLQAGDHLLETMVTGGDGFGVEIDILFVNATYPAQCAHHLYLPTILTVP